MHDKKKITINMIVSLAVFAINMGINFFLSPYIIKNIGTEAYGFVSLANNFVNYATIITLAINSMANRFITIAIHKKDNKSANRYFNSVLIANIITILVLIIPAIILVIKLDKILNIPEDIIIDVKILFMVIFVNFFISIIDSTYSIATFATNNLYIHSLNTLKSYIIKVGLMVALFAVFIPKVFYVGLAILVASIFLLITDVYYTKKLLPNIKIHPKYFSKKSIVTLILSGIWNTITKLGQTLTDGLDLIICNLMIDATSMGRLAIAKTISSVLGTLISTVSNIFQPELTIYYAKREIRELVKNTKRAMKITGFFTNIPLAFIWGFGIAFYKLWMPTEDAQLLSVLTILTLMGTFFSGAITPLYAIYTITNKIKIDAICRVILGFLNIGAVFLALKYTTLGIYAVASFSIIIGTIFNIIFVPTYASYCLKIKRTAFYPEVIRYFITTLILVGCVCLLGNYLIVDNWINLISAGIITSMIGIVINSVLLLNKEERYYLVGIIKSKLR